MVAEWGGAVVAGACAAGSTGLEGPQKAFCRASMVAAEWRDDGQGREPQAVFLCLHVPALSRPSTCTRSAVVMTCL